MTSGEQDEESWIILLYELPSLNVSKEPQFYNSARKSRLKLFDIVYNGTIN